MALPRVPRLALAADTGRSRADRVTSNGTIHVSGLIAGAIWQLSRNGGRSWRRGSGRSFSVPRGSYAKGQVQVRQRSSAGPFSAANTTFAAFTVDSVAAVPRLALVADTGRFSRDRITNQGRLRLSGLEKGATWQMSLDGGTTWRKGSGTSVLVPQGVYGAGAVQVRQRDLAGNLSGPETSFAAFTVDTAPPAIPALTLATDTGVSATDRITGDGTLLVSGLEAGASWQYSLNGGGSWLSGTGSSVVLADGTYPSGAVQVRQRDLAGNLSGPETSFAAFTVDTSAPAMPGLALAEDTGVSATDRITSNGTLLVSGLEAGASWQYSLNGGGSWLSGTGSSVVVADGTYPTGRVRVRQTDRAGNTSRVNQGFPAFTVVQPSLSITGQTANINKSEGNAGTTPFPFQITRNGDTTITSSVTWTVTGTGRDSANALDFAGDALPSGTVTFAPGDTTETLSVQVVADTLFGPDETFAVTLSNPTSATISTATAVGVIRNDDLSIQEPVFVKESILPDGALGAAPGKGWTATGLVHDPLEDVFWVANLGKAKKGDPGETPSIVKMDKDGTRILAQINVKNAFPDTTLIQGLTLDSRSQSLWFTAPAQNKLRSVSKSGSRLRELAFSAPNGLAYDPRDDRLIVLHPGKAGSSSLNQISVVNKSTGAVIRSYSTGTLPGFDWVFGADMLHFDPETRYLYMSYGSDPQPGSIRVFDHDAGQQIGTIGALQRVTSAEGVAIVGSSIYMVSDDYIDTNTPNRLISFRHVKVASSEGRDVVTGTAAADVFSWDTLAQTSLVSYDSVASFSSDDKLFIRNGSYEQTLRGSVGNLSALTYANLISLLNSARLPANRASAFTVTGMPGTFVALNDSRSAFQSDTDGLVFLKQYSIGSVNSVMIV